MKKLGAVLIGLALVACAPQMTMEELEDQAMLTGDWSAVDKRERILRRKARREAASEFACPDGYVAMCDSSFADTRCACVDRGDFRRMISSH